MDEDWYLIFSIELNAWWGPDGRSHVEEMSKAGRYTRQQAMDIAREAIPGARGRTGMLPPELPVRAMDLEEIAAAFRAAYPKLPPEMWE